MAETSKTVEQLFVERKIDARQLAERAGLDESRVAAIMLGRWTPSPSERDAISAVFALTRDQIVWGHKTPIQHLYADISHLGEAWNRSKLANMTTLTLCPPPSSAYETFLPVFDFDPARARPKT